MPRPMSPRQCHRQQNSAAPLSAWSGSTIASMTQHQRHTSAWSPTSMMYDFSGKQTRCQLIPVLFTTMFGSRANANVPMHCLVPPASRLTFEAFKLYTPELNSLKDLIWESGATPNRCTYTVPLFDQFSEKALNNFMPEYLVPEIEYSAKFSRTMKI
jgi:hypothetical protein